MKCGLYILLALLILLAIGQYLLKKFLVAPKITAEVDLGKAFLEKKILYKIDYSGVKFDGVYVIGAKPVQSKKAGDFTISTIKSGGFFGIELYKKGKLVGELKVDILKQKIILNTNKK